MNNKLLKLATSGSTIENLAFDGVSSHQAVNDHGLHLAYTVTSILGLEIDLGILAQNSLVTLTPSRTNEVSNPVTVVDDNRIGRSKVDPQPASSGAEKKYGPVWNRIKLVDLLNTILVLDRPVNTATPDTTVA